MNDCMPLEDGMDATMIESQKIDTLRHDKVGRCRLTPSNPR